MPSVRFRSLEELSASGALGRARPDKSMMGRLLARAEKDLMLARELSGRDPERAVALAYEAGLRACLTLLQLAGYRVRSEPGHHRIALEASAAFVDAGAEVRLSHLNDAREFRNASLYGEPLPAGEDFVRQVVDDARDLLAEARRRFESRSAG
jgi:hypothetical protein